MMRQKGRFSSFIIRLAIIATALSVATMVVSMAFISGFKHEIREKIFSFWGHVQVTPYTTNNTTIVAPDPITLDKHFEQQVKAVPHVQTMQPFVLRPAILNANHMMEGLQLKGIQRNYDYKWLNLQGTGISYNDTSYSKDVVLSKTTADRMNLKIGDDILLYFLEPGATFPRIRKVKIGGLYHTGMEDIDKSYGLCDIKLLQRINNWKEDEVNGYQLSLSGMQYADTVASSIYYDIIPQDSKLTTYTMKEIYPNIYDWLKLQDVNGVVILFIMAVVAIINLAVALLILIIEQAKMVGILKAQGMQEGKMRLIFLYHAGLIGGVGIIIGNILGLGLCVLQQQTGFLTLSESTYYMQYVPVKIVWWHTVLIDLSTILLCILCMWLPTLYIRRIQPAKVLQFK